MTTYYLRSGSGNWNDPTRWSLTSGGGSAGAFPTSTDDVIMDASSGSVTINGTVGSPSACRSVTCTGHTGTIGMGGGVYWDIYGSATFVSGQTFSPNSTSFMTFKSTTTGNTIATGGKTLPRTIFDGVGGEWTMQSNSAFTNAYVSLLNGHLNTNGFAVSAEFQSSNSNTRALTLGATVWSLPGTVTNPWNIENSTGMTLSAGSSTITLTGSGTGVTFSGGSLSYGTVNLNNTNIVGRSIIVTGSNSFTSMTLSLGNGGTPFLFGGNQTIGTLTANGSSVIDRTWIMSTVRGVRRTLTVSTLNASYIDIEDIEGAGSANWNLSAITGLSGDCGNNSGITFTTPTTVYWVPASGTSTGSIGVATRWATSSGGTAGTGRVPLPQDTMIFDANSIDSTSRTITVNLYRIGDMNFTGATNTPALAKTTNCYQYGSLTLISAMTNSGTTLWSMKGPGTTLTMAGGTLTNNLIIDCGDSLGTVTHSGNLTTSATITMTSGTFTGTSTDTITCSAMTFNGGTFNPVATTTINGGIIVNSGTHTQVQAFANVTAVNCNGGEFITNQAFSATTITMNAGSKFTTGGNVTLSSQLVVQGGEYNSPNYTCSASSSNLTSGICKLKGWSSSISFSNTGCVTEIGTSGLSCTSIAISAGSVTALSGAVFTPSSTTQITTTGELYGYPNFTSGAAATISTSGITQIGTWSTASQVTVSNGNCTIQGFTTGGFSCTSGSLTILDASVTVSGAITVSGTGTLNFNGDITSTNTLTLSSSNPVTLNSFNSNSNVTISGGSHTITTLATTGTLQISGGTNHFIKTTSASSFTLSGSGTTCRFGGNITLTSTISFNGTNTVMDAKGFDFTGCTSVTFTGINVTTYFRNILASSTVSLSSGNINCSGRIQWSGGTNVLYAKNAGFGAKAIT